MRTSLLHHYRDLREVPPGVASEAAGWGLEVRSPVADHAETVDDFLDIYCRDAAPAGALVVAPDPSYAGALQTGIPFTDALRARESLTVDAPLGEPSEASRAFWTVVADAKRRHGAGTLEGLFATMHLAHAFPYALVQGRTPVNVEKYLPSLPLYARESRERLSRLVRLLRPQVIVCVGRLSYEAVASLSENRLDLAAELATRGWESVVLGREYAEGVRTFPRADFSPLRQPALRADFHAFRSHVVPVGELEGPLGGHARDTLLRLVGDAWN